MAEPNSQSAMQEKDDYVTTNLESGDDVPDANKDGQIGRWKRATPFDSAPMLSTPLHDEEYCMNHPRRGTLLLFNQKNFDPKLNLKPRNGTDVDRDKVQALFEKLGFSVKVFNDMTFVKIKQELSKAAMEDHSQSDCFASVMLTHGDEGLLYSCDTKFKPSDLWTPFLADECQSLAGKPKLFFIQACQGTKLDSGLRVKVATDSLQMMKIPAHADFLIACSTVPGYYSWRNSSEGSWFIQALCAILSKYYNTMDLLSLMTKVNHAVAYHFQSYVPNDLEMHDKKQIPYICSMLTKKVYLHPK